MPFCSMQENYLINHQFNGRYKRLFTLISAVCMLIKNGSNVFWVSATFTIIQKINKLEAHWTQTIPIVLLFFMLKLKKMS